MMLCVRQIGAGVEAVPNIERDRFEANGYAVARGLFTRDEVDFYIDHFMQMREAGTYAGDFSGVDSNVDCPFSSLPRTVL
jgi:hypothetical protein